MDKRGIPEVSFIIGLVIASMLVIPMLALIWNSLEGSNVTENNFDDLIDLIRNMEVDEEIDFGFFIKDKSIVSFSKEQAEKYNIGCIEEYCLCLCDVDRGIFHLDFENSCKEGICEGFTDIKLIGKKVDNQILVIEEEKEQITLHLEKKAIGGKEIVGICTAKPCINLEGLQSEIIDGVIQSPYIGTIFEGIELGAFPRESALKINEPISPYLESVKALKHLESEIGLELTGHILYIGFNQEALNRFKNTGKFLNDEYINQLFILRKSGIVPRIALEPVMYTTKEEKIKNWEALIENKEALIQLSKELHKYGSMTMRIGSELNLYDSVYHVSPSNKDELEIFGKSFNLVVNIFKRYSPNVETSFSPLIPNQEIKSELDHAFSILSKYKPYVKEANPNMITGTFYLKSPTEAKNLIRYIDLFSDLNKPFGIDEFGATDYDSFKEFLIELEKGSFKNLIFINFFDYKRDFGGLYRSWQIDGDKRNLLRYISSGYSINDAVVKINKEEYV